MLAQLAAKTVKEKGGGDEEQKAAVPSLALPVLAHAHPPWVCVWRTDFDAVVVVYCCCFLQPLLPSRASTERGGLPRFRRKEGGWKGRPSSSLILFFTTPSPPLLEAPYPACLVVVGLFVAAAALSLRGSKGRKKDAHTDFKIRKQSTTSPD